jgi:hypothetical protein
MFCPLESSSKVNPLLIIASLLMLALSSVRAEEPAFRREVMAVLSKSGCNAGGCHGNGNGKGGFKLSLRGQDPDLDWLSIARDQGGRRINALEPEKSLLLLKATASVAHQGGKRFPAGSPECAVMTAWLRAGAPDSSAPDLRSLEVSPTERVLVEPQAKVALHAEAVFADGSRRDVTRMAVFEPNNDVAKVSAEGIVASERAGETTVLVRYLGRQVPVHLAFVPARPNFAWHDVRAENFIDELIFRKLHTLRMNPSELCSDTVFLRRAYLDLLGVLPTADTARTFIAETAPDKRARLVEALLQRSEFADFWALKWADLLKIEERQLDANGMKVFHGWIRESLAQNKPLDVFARELIAARGSTYENPPANWWRANRDPITRAESTARVFLGTQLNCAQCHNHPFERWTQDDYYNWAGLFARLDYKVLDNKRRDKNDTREFKGDQIVLLKASGSITNPRNGESAVPHFLGGESPQTTPERDELLALADWLPHSPMFARMQVNRVWFHLLGRGLVEPVDDFRASNPPSNPELLDALSEDFVAHGYDMRHLIRTIMGSRTYQLAAEPNGTNADDEANFSRGLVRRLAAEQLLDSMSKALAAPLEIEGYPDAQRLAQVPEGRKHYHPIKDDLDRFELAFGKPPRLLPSECERTCEPTVGQAFQLISGPVIQGLLARSGTRLDGWLRSGKPVREVAAEMFWTALSRPPTVVELERTEEHLATARDQRRAVEDVMWALFNSKEFLFRQ